MRRLDFFILTIGGNDIYMKYHENCAIKIVLYAQTAKMIFV